jgi:predicted RNA-binding Zn-ribbon protein involved in translation (DUF1610 family)
LNDWGAKSAALVGVVRERVRGLSSTVRARSPLTLRSVMLLAVALGLVTAATILYVRSNTGDAAPTDEFVEFYCPRCQQAFQLSHREFEQVWDRREYQRGSQDKTLLFKCWNCGQMTAGRTADRP